MRPLVEQVKRLANVNGELVAERQKISNRLGGPREALVVALCAAGLTKGGPE